MGKQKIRLKDVAGSIQEVGLLAKTCRIHVPTNTDILRFTAFMPFLKAFCVRTGF